MCVVKVVDEDVRWGGTRCVVAGVGWQGVGRGLWVGVSLGSRE